MVSITVKGLREIRFGLILISIALFPFFLIHAAIIYQGIFGGTALLVRFMQSTCVICISTIVFLVLFLIGWVNTLVGLAVKARESRQFGNLGACIVGIVMWVLTIPLVAGMIIFNMTPYAESESLLFFRIALIIALLWMIVALIPQHYKMRVRRWVFSLIATVVLLTIVSLILWVIGMMEYIHWTGVWVMELAYMICMPMHIIAFSRTLWAKPRVVLKVHRVQKQEEDEEDDTVEVAEIVND